MLDGWGIGSPIITRKWPPAPPAGASPDDEDGDAGEEEESEHNGDDAPDTDPEEPDTDGGSVAPIIRPVQFITWMIHINQCQTINQPPPWSQSYPTNLTWF